MVKRLTSSFKRQEGLRKAKKPHQAWFYGMAVVIVLFLAFSLRVRDLGRADLTFDEVATFYVAHRPILEMIRYVMGAAREHPPAYYLVMSLWMRLAGVSEFAVRFPSVLIGVLAVSWSYQVGQRLPGRHGGWWSALLCAVIPFSIWAGRTGRMYALVLLLSLVVMDSWLRWLAHPDWQHWLGFITLSMIAAMTHYYLTLLWPVQGLVLLLAPRKTRAIRQPWILTLVGVGCCVGGFVVVSPGIRAMMVEVARRFPYKGFRGTDLGIVFTDLYIWGYRPELLWTGLVGLGLTVVGWGILMRREPLKGLLFTAWGIVPLIIAHSVPERLETRYLTPIFPALMFGLAALLAQLRYPAIRILATGGLLGLAMWRLPLFYDNPDTTFSTRVEALHVAARPGDALVMNGPWPALLLTYYQPPEFLNVYLVPAEAPPGFSADVDIPHMEEIFHTHDRVWVSYGAIHWADPQYSVSRWLAENTYLVFQRAGMALYLPQPEDMEAVQVDIDLGPRMRLLEATLDRMEARVGDIVRVGLDFQGENLDQKVGITIGLLDGHGAIWQQGDTLFGPVHQLYETILPDRWHEQRGLLLLPGLPPGHYILAVKAEGEGINPGDLADVQGWIPLSPLEIRPGMADSNLVAMLPHPGDAEVTFGDGLNLVGVQPYAANVMQGYPTGFYVWWQVTAPVNTSDMKIRLVGPETWEGGSFSLGPDFYPSTTWQAGDVIRQSVFFQLPDALPAGSYRVQVAMQTGMDPLTADPWRDIFSFEVEARKRHYEPPLFRTRQDVRFGSVLRLRGYRLERKNVHPGESVNFTVYWQALGAPAQIYAVFNHLRDHDALAIWQGDSWPQAGLYTTDHWQKNEVVAETYTIVIPVDLPAGDYALYTGVYDPATGTRLAATDNRGERLVNDEFLLLHLQVSPE
jgi:4-amino-4-deoxy-L-arabinose transferase-like glycosyltransferase